MTRNKRIKKLQILKITFRKDKNLQTLLTQKRQDLERNFLEQKFNSLVVLFNTLKLNDIFFGRIRDFIFKPITLNQNAFQILPTDFFVKNFDHD